MDRDVSVDKMRSAIFGIAVSDWRVRSSRLHQPLKRMNQRIQNQYVFSVRRL